MALRRSASFSLSPSPTPSSPTPTTPATKKPRVDPASSPSYTSSQSPAGTKKTTKAKTSTPNASKGGVKVSKAQDNGTWTADKKGVFMDEVIAAGYKAVDLDALALKLGLAKRQLIDQLVPNRNNLRGKAVKGAKGE